MYVDPEIVQSLLLLVLFSMFLILGVLCLDIVLFVLFLILLLHFVLDIPILLCVLLFRLLTYTTLYLSCVRRGQCR